MPQVLRPDERALKKKYRVTNWLNTRHYKRKQELYFSALDAFALEIGIGPRGEVNGRALMQVLAVVHSGDRQLQSYFERWNRNGTDLEKREAWKRIYEVSAGAVVERWFNADRNVDLIQKDVLASEGELEGRLTEVLNAAERHTTLIEEADDEARAEQYTPPTAQQIDLSDTAREEVEALLREEFTIAQEASGDLGVPKSERDLEISKRALMRLKRADLRAIADEQNLDIEGSEESLADRIVREFDVSEEDIARLVIDNEEGAPERGYVSRLVALATEPNLAQAAARLRLFLNSYIRVGVARWFVFTEVTASDTDVRVRGMLRYYRVSPKVEDGEYSLAAEPRSSEIEMRLRHGVPWIELSAKRGGETNALVSALQSASGVRARGILPLAMKAPEGVMTGWDRRTVFMLDFMQTSLEDETIHRSDQRTARFESDAPGHDVTPGRPLVTSVRLQGQQLMSHQQACDLIVAGRGLLSLDLVIRYRVNAEQTERMPIRIELADSHASVFTGFTDSAESVTRRAHDELVRRLRRALVAEIADEAKLLALADQIVDRAQGEAPDEADILPDAGDWGDGYAASDAAAGGGPS